MRGNRVEGEKISVPQAESNNTALNIAHKTLNECNVSCMELNQFDTLPSEYELLLRQSAHAVGHHAQTNSVPAMNQNVPVVIHPFGFIGDPVDKVHRALEV